MSIEHDTIVACCTQQGGSGGAVALIRVSGPSAISLVSLVAQLSSGISILNLPSHTVHHGYVVTPSGNTLDEVLFTVMHAPRTFTGEHTVEITCHNNPLIIHALIQELIYTGIRLARAGEFAQQAFFNKKMDLSQAEAINDLINAQTAQAIQTSLAQLKGSLSQEVRLLEEELVIAAAWCEASFEFVEEVGYFGKALGERIHRIYDHVEQLLQSATGSAAVREGFRVALIGSVNAGKSSLFNALLDQKRAIVSPLAGTTRDTIEARLVLDGITLTYIDTAGVRVTQDAIEQEGITRSWQESERADLVLLIMDSSRSSTQEEEHFFSQLIETHHHKICVVHNKSDLMAAPVNRQEQVFHISALHQEGIQALKNDISARLKDLTRTHTTPFFINKRHALALTTLKTQLYTVLLQLKRESPAYELIAQDLQDALSALSLITGKSASEAALNAVFTQFCIGK